MAQFKLSKCSDFSNPYAVIVELEKECAISARPVGKTYIITAKDTAAAEVLRGVTQLDGKVVELEELLTSEKPCTYVVLGVPQTYPEELLKERIPGTVTKVQRMTGYDRLKKETYKTTSVKVLGKGHPPEEVSLGTALGTRKVRLFVPEPTRCFRCQLYGHRQHGCRRPVRCSLCSGPHLTKICLEKRKKNEEIVRKCANCGGKHGAGSFFCKVRKEKAEETRKRFQGTVTMKNTQQINQKPPTNDANNFPAHRGVTPAAHPAAPIQTGASTEEQVITMTQTQLANMLETALKSALIRLGLTDLVEDPENKLQAVAKEVAAAPVPTPKTDPPTVWGTTHPTKTATSGTPADEAITEEKNRLKRKQRDGEPSSPNNQAKKKPSPTPRRQNQGTNKPTQTNRTTEESMQESTTNETAPMEPEISQVTEIAQTTDL